MCGDLDLKPIFFMLYVQKKYVINITNCYNIKYSIIDRHFYLKKKENGIIL